MHTSEGFLNIFLGDAFLVAGAEISGTVGEWESYGCLDLPAVPADTTSAQHGACPPAFKVCTVHWNLTNVASYRLNPCRVTELDGIRTMPQICDIMYAKNQKVYADYLKLPKTLTSSHYLNNFTENTVP